MVLFFDLFAQEHCGGFGEHGLFIGTKLGIVGSHECHCTCYIAVCEDRGDGEGVGGDTLDGSKRLGCGIGIVKGFAVFQKLLQGRGEAALGILFFGTPDTATTWSLSNTTAGAPPSFEMTSAA